MIGIRQSACFRRFSSSRHFGSLPTIEQREKHPPTRFRDAYISQRAAREKSRKYQLVLFLRPLDGLIAIEQGKKDPLLDLRCAYISRQAARCTWPSNARSSKLGLHSPALSQSSRGKDVPYSITLCVHLAAEAARCTWPSNASSSKLGLHSPALSHKKAVIVNAANNLSSFVKGIITSYSSWSYISK